VRNGCFCAHPYILQLLQVPEAEARIYQAEILDGDRSHLPGLVRVSFGCYNTLDEVDHLAVMLERIVRGDYAGDYVQDRATSDFLPRGYDPAVISQYFAL
jgi:hypothetical protein